MVLYTVSRDKRRYNAKATWENGIVTIKKGSVINRESSEGFNPKKGIATLRANESLFEKGNILKQDVSFTSLSTAASFVTGRTANGNKVWKTEDGKLIKYFPQDERR